METIILAVLLEKHTHLERAQEMLETLPRRGQA
jgi:hypothetical protein